MEDEGLISNLDEAWNINYEDLDFGKEIGKGGFGSVYQGEYFGTPVAIKKYDLRSHKKGECGRCGFFLPEVEEFLRGRVQDR